MALPTLPAITPAQRRLVLLSALLGWMFDGLEMGIFPQVARPALQQMHGAGADAESFVVQWMGIITALFLLGAAAGGLVFGWLGDRIGRVRALSASILTYSIFTGLVYFVRTPGQLGALRFLAALGMGGEWALGVALVMEIWPDAKRAWLAGLIGVAGNAGFMLIALIGLGFAITQDSWRVVALIGAAPALLTFFIRWWVPESHRWQAATAIAPARPLHEIFSRQLWRRMILAILLCSVVLIGTWSLVQWLPLWAGKLAGDAAPKARAWTQAWSALGAMIGSVAGAWLAVKCGRRLGYFILCAGSLASCLAIFGGTASYGPHFLALTFLAGGITAAFYGLLPLYLPELFPTRVRATAQGLAYNFGRVLAALGALQMSALMGYFDNNYARAGEVLSLIYVVGLLVIWLAPETQGQPLPE
jgi:MFS family permease